MQTIQIVEKKNPLAVHGIFDSLERANHFLEQVIPEYVRRGYYMDKTLKDDGFRVLVSTHSRRVK